MLAFKYRFHGHGSLRFVYKYGKIIRKEYYNLKYTKNNHRKYPRFSIVISKKVIKKAVKRNIIRRRLYEIIRKEKFTDIPPYDLVFIISSEKILELNNLELINILSESIKTIISTNNHRK